MKVIPWLDVSCFIYKHTGQASAITVTYEDHTAQSQKLAVDEEK